MSEKIYDIAIIGAGAAGSMAALRSVLNNRDALVFSGDGKTRKRARDTWVDKVVNMPMMFDRKKAIATSVKETFQWIEEHNYFSEKLDIVRETVTEVKKHGDHFELTAKEQSYKAKFVILCTGIMDIQPEVDGSIKPILPYANNGFVDYCLRCDGHKTLGKASAVIGHKEPAAWVATILHERYNPPEMKVFTNGEKPAFSEEISKVLETYNIKVIKDKITGIKGDHKTHMEGLELEGGKFEKVEIAFVSLGQIAYNDLAKSVGAELTKRGNVVTNEKGESSIDGFYVAGDLRSGKKYQIYTAWDMAVDSIDDIDKKLREEFRACKLSAQECKEEALALEGEKN